MSQLFKPKKPVAGGSWLGVQPCRVNEIIWAQDKVDAYDWCDISLQLELDLPESDYPLPLDLTGGFKWEQGQITDGALTYQIYNIAETLGIPLGLTLDGKLADETTGEELDDYTQWLNRQLRDVQPPEGRPYIVYVYPEKNTKNGKVYNRVFERLYPNTDEGKKQLQNDVNYAKKQGWIKEHNPNPESSATVSDPLAGSPLDEDGLENL